MPVDNLRSSYVDMLLEQLKDVRYPSSDMLDRVESAIGDRQTAEAYAAHLLDLMKKDEYPSPSMLKRLDRIIAVLEGG